VRVRKWREMSHEGKGVHRPRRQQKRVRLYPRALDVLRRMVGEGAKLHRHPADGKYRIGEGGTRADTVIPRSLDPLVRFQFVRFVEDGSVTITERGKAFVRRHQNMVVDIGRRRLRKMGVRTFVKPVQFEVVEYDGQNIADVAEVAGPDAVGLRWNHEARRPDVLIGEGDMQMVLQPSEHFIVRAQHQTKVAEVMDRAAFRAAGFKEVHS